MPEPAWREAGRDTRLFWPLDRRVGPVRALGWLIEATWGWSTLAAFQEDGGGALAIEEGRGAGMAEEAMVGDLRPGSFVDEGVAPKRGRADWRLLAVEVAAEESIVGCHKL